MGALRATFVEAVDGLSDGCEKPTTTTIDGGEPTTTTINGGADNVDTDTTNAATTAAENDATTVAEDVTTSTSTPVPTTPEFEEEGIDGAHSQSVYSVAITLLLGFIMNH